MFAIGSTYTRDEINSQIGGGRRACLLQSRGTVVGVCYVDAMNPQAPRALLVSRGPQKERAAQLLAKQESPVPVFVKRRSNAWEHLGNYKARRYIAARKQRARYAKGSGRKDVVGVLLLAPA
jgi:hypothetical protein